MKTGVYSWFLNSLTLLCATAHSDEVVFALNLGGVAHKGSDGVVYTTDTRKLATWSTYKRITGASDQDQAIYGTQFSTPIHGLDLMLPGAGYDGNYTLILKYIATTTSHLQNVTLNAQHLVVMNLNVSKEAGSLYTAYDRTVDFRIHTGVLRWRGEQSRVVSNQLRLQATGDPETQLAALVLRCHADGDVRNVLTKYWQKLVNAYQRGFKGLASDVDEL